MKNTIKPNSTNSIEKIQGLDMLNKNDINQIIKKIITLKKEPLGNN